MSKTSYSIAVLPGDGIGVEVPLVLLQGSEVREVKVKSIDRLEFLRRKPTL